ELIAGKIRRLDPGTSEILMLASCLGAQFSLDELSDVAAIKRTEAASRLWSALEEELIIPLSDRNKYIEETDDSADSVQYRFLHDRVQQAAYDLLDEERKTAIHLQIGRRSLEKVRASLVKTGNTAVGEQSVSSESSVEHSELLFEIVNHLNQGITLITD